MFDNREKFISYINSQAWFYGIKRNHNSLAVYSWIKGKKMDRKMLRTVNVPLWVLIEISKILSNAKSMDNLSMHNIEKHIRYYSGWGRSIPVFPSSLPLILTPEMYSVIFHFLGDGHIGKTNVSSSYRQMNPLGLKNFLSKLQNSFGKFGYGLNEFNNGRLNVPKIITDFYAYYFLLPDTDTFVSYVPEHLKKYPADFLKVALFSFIVDEGNIGEVITIYSKNKQLLSDIHDIGEHCGYICHPIREKYACKKFDCYRFSISSYSYPQIKSDIARISQIFPTCDLAHKTAIFLEKIPNSSLSM